ncbi:MAG: hemolysin family protein [Proteobacteria bacterium]|nr:hemolysin family protein [Pseudomonadota bacterium]MDA0994325.1 hemolysin family protein [Pseudomonadota bacterium]
MPGICEQVSSLEDIMQIFITAVSVALIVSFLCSIFEAVLLSINNAQVESLAQQGKRHGQILKEFKRRIDLPIAAILITNTMAHTIGTAVAGAAYVDAFSSETLWIFAIIFTIAVLLFTEIIPKTLGIAHAARLAKPVAYGIHTLTVALRPLVLLSGAISRSLRSEKNVPMTSVEEIRLLTAFARTEGVIGVQTAGIIVGASWLGNLSASDVMRPRNQVIYLSAESNRQQVLELLKHSRYSRFPFSTTDQFDQVCGVVIAKELLLQLQDGSDETIDWSCLVKEPIVVPENARLDSLLRIFKDACRHMAIVVDEYGDVQGIVTLEDVLEEIVGDIVDESDRVIVDLWIQDDGSFHALGTIELRKLCRKLEIKLPADTEARRLGGLVMELLGRIPVKGDTVEWHGCRLTVLSASRWSADLVSIAKKT